MKPNGAACIALALACGGLPWTAEAAGCTIAGSCPWDAGILVVGACGSSNFWYSGPATTVANTSPWVIPSDGTLVGWCVDIGSSGTAYAMTFEVWRPIGDGGTFSCVGSDSQTTVVGINCFTLGTPLSVLGGDLLGMESGANVDAYSKGGGGSLGYSIQSGCPLQLSTVAEPLQPNIWVALCPSASSGSDAGSIDAGSTDGGVPDAGAFDAGSLDAGFADAGPGTPGDAGTRADGGASAVPDASVVAGGSGPRSWSVGCGCGGPGGASDVLVFTALLALVRRRAR